MEMFKTLLLMVVATAISAQMDDIANTPTQDSPVQTPSDIEVKERLENFVLVSMEPSADDLIPYDLQLLHRNASQVYANISRNSSESHPSSLGTNTCYANSTPEVYADARRTLPSLKFPSNLVATSFAQISATENCPHCSHYVCESNTRRLYWFPLYTVGGHVRDYCYLPWALQQNITYATCKCDTCKHPYGAGKCRPSCFERRRMLVRCFHSHHHPKYYGHWYWTWVTRNLPQKCMCSYN